MTMRDRGSQSPSNPPSWDEDLRHWLEEYINRYPQHTTEVLSRSPFIGVSRSALDEYLAGTYFLTKEHGGRGFNQESSNIEKAISAYRVRVEGTARHGYAKTFVETHTWSQLRQACATAIRENIIVVVYGRPGVGKSRCLREFALQDMVTSPLLVLCSRNITPLYFAQKLARELNITKYGKLPLLEDEIGEKLKRYPRPIFVDQANYLTEKSLGSICYIWEVAHMPIVLSGTKALYDLFTTSPLTEDVRAQLSSRVAVHYLLAELSLAEAKAIIQQALAEDATDETVAQIFNITGGIHRHIDMILPRIIDLKARNEKKLAAGEVKLSDIIATAGSRLMT
jgi:DNA transposition AAA+ family ATPase